MSVDPPKNTADRNIERLLENTLRNTGWQGESSCLSLIQQTLRQERRRRKQFWFYPLSAAAALIFVLLFWIPSPPKAPVIVGHIQEVQGFLRAQKNGHTENLEVLSPIYADQRLETRAGSTAAIELQDASTLSPAPRTVLQVHQTSGGSQVYLQAGALRIHAAKQARGKALHVNTDSAAIKILGTELDVRLFKRPDGSQQTQVFLYSGKLEISSASETVTLHPGMVGITEAHQAPQIRIALWEINELAQLLKQTQQLARDRQKSPGLPILAEFATNTVWAVVSLTQFTHTDTGIYSAELYGPAFNVTAYTLSGSPLDVSVQGKQLRLTIPPTPADNPSHKHVVLKVPQVQGLFPGMSRQNHLFSRTGHEGDRLTLTTLILPPHAQVEIQAGEIIAEKTWLGQRVITALAQTEAFPLVK